MSSLDTILAEISECPLNDQEIINEILTKRIIEEKRKLIAKDYQEAVKNYHSGKVESGGIDNLLGTNSQ